MVSEAKDNVKGSLVEKDDNKKTVLIPCPNCGEIVKIQLDVSITNKIECFPFPILAMHTGAGKNIHTLVAYIDKQLRCRHAEYLSGKRVFITPFIAFNPSLLQIYCNKHK